MTTNIETAAATVAGLETKLATARQRIATLDGEIKAAAYEAHTSKSRDASKRLATLQTESLELNHTVAELGYALTEARSRAAQAEHAATVAADSERQRQDAANAAALRDAGFAADAALTVALEEIGKFATAHAALGATRPHIRGALFAVNMRRAIETAAQRLGVKGRALAPSERLGFGEWAMRMVGPGPGGEQEDAPAVKQTESSPAM
jgi:chromosome segregation ATPase